MFLLFLIFPPLGFLFVLIGLIVLCVVSRLASVVLGLTLAVVCAVGAFEIMTDPQSGDMWMTGVLFLPWMGFGVWLIADGLKKE
jgi:uncharacterized membrane protein